MVLENQVEISFVKVEHSCILLVDKIFPGMQLWFELHMTDLKGTKFS